MDMRKLFVIMIMFLGLAYADVIPLDYHSVDHRLYIDNFDEYGEYQFFVYPTDVGGELPESLVYMDTSEVPGFYKFAATYIYAIKKTDMENRTPEEFLPLALKSQEPLGRIDTLPNTDPRTNIETHYTVSLTANELVLTRKDVGDVIVDGDGDGCPPERGPDYYLLAVGLGVGLIIGYLAGKKL
jgi:hypothetical protein